MSKPSPFRYFRTSPEIVRFAVMLNIQSVVRGFRRLLGFFDKFEQTMKLAATTP